MDGFCIDAISRRKESSSLGPVVRLSGTWLKPNFPQGNKAGTPQKAVQCARVGCLGSLPRVLAHPQSTGTVDSYHARPLADLFADLFTDRSFY
jgi:hypothetical protein